MVEVRQLSKQFGDVPVLKGVNATFPRGRITAVVGPNASGKTTLLKTILGLVMPSSGTILFEGEPVTPTDWQFRRRIGYMPQTPRFPENLSVAEVLDLVERIRGVKAASRDQLLDRFNLGPFRTKPVGKLSGGTRQKVNAVAAMMFDVPALICDEPTAGLDPVASSRLKDGLVHARQAGTTIILTSHHMAELEGLADVVVFLLEGEIRFSGSTAEICALTGEATLERAVAHLMQERL